MFTGFGETNWHSDANMVPLDTNRFVTLWLPLRPLREDDAALVFASGSHRDFALPYWHTLEGEFILIFSNLRGYPVWAVWHARRVPQLVPAAVP